ncbi:MAG: acylphosphatase [Methanolinea sp.]
MADTPGITPVGASWEPTRSKTIEVRIAGRVQKVGLRNCVRHIAGKLNIRGEVMNLPDGTVKITASGDPLTLDKFVSMIYGCPRAHIRDMEICEVPFRSFPDFSVVYPAE